MDQTLVRWALREVRVSNMMSFFPFEGSRRETVILFDFNIELFFEKYC